MAHSGRPSQRGTQRLELVFSSGGAGYLKRKEKEKEGKKKKKEGRKRGRELRVNLEIAL
jgi:hypothetical protein